MSKTCRRSMMYMDCNCGALVRPRQSWNNGKWCGSVQEEINISKRRESPPDRECRCEQKIDYYSKRNSKRDRKNPWRPDKAFKDVSRKLFKAQVRNAMNQRRYDCMPIIKKTNIWDWN